MKNIVSRVKQDSKSVEKEPFHGQCGGLYQRLNFIALLPLGEIGKLCFPFFFFMCLVHRNSFLLYVDPNL